MGFGGFATQVYIFNDKALSAATNKDSFRPDDFLGVIWIDHALYESEELKGG